MTKLAELTGKLVRLSNVADDVGDYDKPHFQLIGILQHDEDEPYWTVNGGDHPSGHGLQRFSFQENCVDEIAKGSSGIWLICLK